MERGPQPPHDAPPNTPPLDGVHALIEEKHLTFKSPQAAYDMLSDLFFEANNDPALPNYIPQTIHTVMLATGFLAYDHLRGSKQGIFLARLDAEREHLQTDRLELSQDEADVLHHIAQSVGLDYDPGTEETPEQRVFLFSSVENRPPQGPHDLDMYRLMTGRKTLPESTPIIVDSDPTPTPTES